MFSFLKKITASLFGSSSNGKGLVTQVSDVVDRWNPSDSTRHEMSIEDQQAGDESQKSARLMPVAPSHDSWLDVFVDAFNRIIRPTITLWVLGGLIGWWDFPTTGSIDPVILNIAWTVITFWFGSRVIFKDIPNAISLYRKLK